MLGNILVVYWCILFFTMNTICMHWHLISYKCHIPTPNTRQFHHLNTWAQQLLYVFSCIRKRVKLTTVFCLLFSDKLCPYVYNRGSPLENAYSIVMVRDVDACWGFLFGILWDTHPRLFRRCHLELVHLMFLDEKRGMSNFVFFWNVHDIAMITKFSVLFCLHSLVLAHVMISIIYWNFFHSS